MNRSMIIEEEQSQIRNRPQSASQFEFNKIGKRRPFSSLKQVPRKLNHTSDVSLLSRIRPSKILSDKEKLYEENLALKVRLNSMEDDLLRYRSIARHLEQECVKKDKLIVELRGGGPKRSFKNLHLVNNLRNNIKELKNKMLMKDDSISKLRQNIITTKHAEIESEMQAYIDECTRLRHHLEEVLKQQESAQLMSETNDHLYLRHEVQNLQNQNKQLSQELQTWKDKCTELDKRKRPGKKTDGTFKLEIAKLRAQLDTKSKELELCQDYAKDLEKQLPTSSKIQTKAKASSEVKNIFKHISMRMQLHRLPKTSLIQTLFGRVEPERDYNKEKLKELFKKNPFSFKEEELEDFVVFLTDRNSTQGEICDAILENIEDWTIFSNSDEEAFDKELSSVLSRYKISLKEACKIHDPNKTGVITLKDFTSVLDDMDLSFNSDLLHYISLLFYSHSYDLNLVPYRNFLKAYSELREDDEDEDEKAEIIRSYLKKIADKLIDKKMRARDIFIENNEGLIYPKEFIEGLCSLEIKDVDADTVQLLMEALQADDTKEICVSANEFEEILEHYGVPRNLSARFITHGSNTISEKSPFRNKEFSSGLNSVIVKDSSDAFYSDFDDIDIK